MASCDFLHSVSAVVFGVPEVDVNVPYPAKAHQRRTSAGPRALVVDPRENLRPVDKVWVWGKRDVGEGLAWPGGSVCVRVSVLVPVLRTLSCTYHRLTGSRSYSCLFRCQ
jgi:hypothetical protein